MRKNRLFWAIFVILLCFMLTGNASAIKWTNRKVPTFIHSNLYIYNDKTSYLEPILASDIGYIEPFEPSLAHNGDSIVISLYATGDLINIDYVQEESAGIECFKLSIKKVDVCGTHAIKEVYANEDIHTPVFVYMIDQLEDGFYMIKIEATSKANGYRSSTMENIDEEAVKYYFFKVGDVGSILGHEERIETLYARNGNEEESTTLTENSFFNAKFKKGSKIYIDSKEAHLPANVKGFCYIIGDNEPKYVDKSGFLTEEDIGYKERVYIKIAFVFEDGCIGKFTQGFIRFYE